jgi:hypothetical protein
MSELSNICLGDTVFLSVCPLKKNLGMDRWLDENWTTVVLAFLEFHFAAVESAESNGSDTSANNFTGYRLGNEGSIPGRSRKYS